MDTKKHRKIEIRLRSMKDEKEFNLELAEKQERIACDGVFLVTFLEEAETIQAHFSSIDGETLTKFSNEELYKAWVSYTAFLANNTELEENHRKFLIHILNLLKMKSLGVISFPEEPSGQAS